MPEPESRPQVTVTVPVLRERDNIEELVKEIGEAFSGADFTYEILFIDDNSQDGSKELCEELSKKYPIRFHERTTETGLASAIIAGIRKAEGDVIVNMDGDHSHPPAVLRQLVEPLLAGEADFSMGSRYVEGGSADPNETSYRFFVAQIGKLAAIGVAHRLSDPGAGYFAVRREALPDLSQIVPIGYKVGLSIYVHADYQLDRVLEVPIDFRPRNSGKSKLTGKVILGYLALLAHLYLVKFIRRPLRKFLGS